MESLKKSASVLYLSSLLQGITLVSVPASSTFLRSLHGISDAQYGAIFLPQVAMAILGSLAGAALSNRFSLKFVLCLTLIINSLSQLCLASSIAFPPTQAFILIVGATTLLGLGFGLSAAPLNSLPQLLFPKKANAAVVAIHTLMGIGLSIGPLLARSFIAEETWVRFPLMLTGLTFFFALLSTRVLFPSHVSNLTENIKTTDFKKTFQPQYTAAFWNFLAIVVLYAFAEGTFSNWIVIYLQENKQLPLSIATFALSMFWASIATGRLLIFILLLNVPARLIWRTLPILMGISFLLLPYAEQAGTAVFLFALAGFSCSGFFPLTVGMSSFCFKNHIAFVSSMMTAALMLGVGFGTFAIGPLRNFLPFETIYQGSVGYTILILLLATFLLKSKIMMDHP